MIQRSSIPGLGSKWPKGLRCNRCDVNLDNSLWNEVKVVFCVNRKKKFVCVKCATRMTKNNTVLVSINDLDLYVSRLITKSLIKIKVIESS